MKINNFNPLPRRKKENFSITQPLIKSKTPYVVSFITGTLISAPFILGGGSVLLNDSVEEKLKTESLSTQEQEKKAKLKETCLEEEGLCQDFDNIIEN
jgi:hypothetical protein